MNGAVCVGGTVGLLVFLVGCEGNHLQHCTPPEQHQQVYPYTGEWQVQGAEGILCLYQTGPQSVYCSLGNVRAVGIVHPSGELFLALAPSAEAEVYASRLLYDTLTVENGLSSSGLLLQMPTRWLRQKPVLP